MVSCPQDKATKAGPLPSGSRRTAVAMYLPHRGEAPAPGIGLDWRQVAKPPLPEGSVIPPEDIANQFHLPCEKRPHLR